MIKLHRNLTPFFPFFPWVGVDPGERPFGGQVPSEWLLGGIVLKICSISLLVSKKENQFHTKLSHQPFFTDLLLHPINYAKISPNSSSTH